MNNPRIKDFNHAAFKPFTALGLGMLATVIVMWVVGDQIEQLVKARIFFVVLLMTVAAHFHQVRHGHPAPKGTDAQRSSREILQGRINQNQETLEQPKAADKYERNEAFLNVFKQKVVQLKQDVSDLANGSD